MEGGGIEGGVSCLYLGFGGYLLCIVWEEVWSIRVSYVCFISVSHRCASLVSN
jgi:hypothetical protein